MHFFILLTVVTIVIDSATAENIAGILRTNTDYFLPDYGDKREVPKEPTDKATSKIAVKEYLPTTTAAWDANTHVNPLWAYHTASRRTHNTDGNIRQHLLHNAPKSLTRIAKTISLGFDPRFDKGYFEPFEKRTKPVTLLGVRKNGLFPRQTINMASKSSEVAELQSPYNHVSSFWVEERA